MKRHVHVGTSDKKRENKSYSDTPKKRPAQYIRQRIFLHIGLSCMVKVEDGHTSQSYLVASATNKKNKIKIKKNGLRLPSIVIYFDYNDSEDANVMETLSSMNLTVIGNVICLH